MKVISRVKIRSALCCQSRRISGIACLRVEHLGVDVPICSQRQIAFVKTDGVRDQYSPLKLRYFVRPQAAAGLVPATVS
jgi:hypothetical protein